MAARCHCAALRTAMAGATGIINVQMALTQLCERTEGLTSITVTDRDGVVVLKAPPAADEDPNAEQILTTIFSLTTEQTSKIEELGAANFIMTRYDDCMCIQCNLHPLVIRIIAEAEANGGALIELLPQVKAILGRTRDIINGETDPS